MFLNSTTKALATLFAVHHRVNMRVQFDYVSENFLLWVEVQVQSGSGPENYPEPDPNCTGPQRGSQFGMRTRTGPGSGSGFGENGLRTGPHQTVASLAGASWYKVGKVTHHLNDLTDVGLCSRGT